ncbi:MAG: MgtC/SapB family protein [Clostridia bacterium]|nr:MgtC/SapB family protein [Clostridia bacterium]
MIYPSDPIGTLLGQWAVELNTASILFRIALSVLFAAVIGWERSSKRHSAGLRTFLLVSLASTAAMLLDVFLKDRFTGGLPLLSAASVIAGAVISVNSVLFSSRSQIKGLTTSVGLWVCGMIGLALGAGCYTVAFIAFLALLAGLALFPALEVFLKNCSNHFEVHLELTASARLQDFVATIRKLNMTIDDIELNPAYANSGLAVYTVAISIHSKELKQYKSHAEIIEALASLDYVYHIEEMRQ